jgi:hypothetical protein
VDCSMPGFETYLLWDEPFASGYTIETSFLMPI